MFSTFTDDEHRSEQSAIGRSKTTHDLFRNVVSTVIAMQKVQEIQERQVSKLTHDVSQLNEVVKSLRDSKKRIGNVEEAAASDWENSEANRHRAGCGDIEDVLKTEYIYTPPKVSKVETKNAMTGE